MKKQFSKYFIAVLFFIIYTVPAIAGPGDGGDGMDTPDEPTVPIDSWVYVVLTLAIVYAYYNFKNKKAIS